MPQLFQTEPSGAYSAWKANAIGRNSKNLREFLEKKYTEGLGEEETKRVAIETVMEVVESGKNIELFVARNGQKVFVGEEEIEGLVKQIEK